MPDDLSRQHVSAARREPIRRLHTCWREDVHTEIPGGHRKPGHLAHRGPLRVSAIPALHRCVARAVLARRTTVSVLTHDVQVPVHPSHSARIPSSASAACSSSRSTQQFATCGSTQ
jgi:hypothetical protein